MTQPDRVYELGEFGRVWGEDLICQALEIDTQFDYNANADFLEEVKVGFTGGFLNYLKLTTSQGKSIEAGSESPNLTYDSVKTTDLEPKG